jgi:molecular chaperone DnaK
VKVGIDLGTTYSAVAFYDKGSSGAEVIPDANGCLLTPSVICFSADGTISVGQTAKSMQSRGEGVVAASFKRAMGDTQYSLTAYGRTYSAEDFSAVLLKYLIAGAEARTGKKIDSAVITVPAYFNDLQRTATIRAGQKSGIEILKVVNEPTAAAISYGYNKAGNKTVMVYDLGGGTFDTTVVRIERGNIIVLGTDGNHILGGKDWDQAIMSYLCGKFKDDFNIDLRDDMSSKNSLIVAAEDLKKELSESECVSAHLEYGDDCADYILTRNQFDEMTEPLFGSTWEVCERVLADIGLRWEDIDEILLVGGSTRLPGLPGRLASISGRKVIKHADTDLAVAKGAAITAHHFGKDGNAVLGVADVASHSLGALSVREDGKKFINEIMIKRNSCVPCSVRKPFRIEPGNLSDSIELFTLQGESRHPLDCVVLARMRISGIMNNGEGVLIEIEYNYDENGVVCISAFQNGSELTVESEKLPEDISWMGGRPDERPSNAPVQKNIVVAIDISRSMKDAPLDKAKRAISRFIKEVADSNTKFGLIVFGDKNLVVRELTLDRYAVTRSIEDIKVKMAGRGTDASPFKEACRMLMGRAGNNMIVVLTDGKWGNRDLAVTQAMECRKDGITTIAVGFGEADRSFLRQIATADEDALFTTLDQLGDTFGTIATAVNSGGIGMSDSRRR